MGERHVLPDGGQWKIIDPDGARATARTGTRQQAVGRAGEIIQNDGCGGLVAHGTRGRIRDKSALTAADAPGSARG